MGGQNSKKREEAYARFYKRLRRGYGAKGGNLDYHQLEPSEPLLRKWQPFPGGLDKAQRSSSTSSLDTTHMQAAAAEKDVTLPTEEEQPSEEEEEEVGFPVCPQRPLREPTYKDLVDFSHFLKEKGGLKGIWWSLRRETILDLYAQNEWGFIKGWQSYTKGPGIRYPKMFGFLFKLVPVEVDEDLVNQQCNRLLNSSQMGPIDDPEGERLMWQFDPGLAYTFQACIHHPEEFGHVKSIKSVEEPGCCKRKWWQFKPTTEGCHGDNLQKC
uniref:Protein Nef n=1 Tax=Simian immunodeficiency virus TaxID=11723 RepID=Q7ZB21_SIV|nr:nef protein [Simian immunodeficiency virus]